MRPRQSRTWGAALALGTALALTGVTTLPGQAATTYEYTNLDQTAMKAVTADSVETTGEGDNGPIELILDGDTDTYWHTQWQGEVAPLPHYFLVDLGSTVEDLGRVTLTPRQSSNGSGRVGEYQVNVTTDEACTTAEGFAGLGEDAFTSVAEGEVPATPTTGSKLDPLDITFTPTSARCVAVVYYSSWGGSDAAETVGSLAEFNAATAVATGEVPDEPEGDGPEIVVPDGALTITDGTLSVHTHPDFPQVVDYQLGDKQIAGTFGEALTSISINGTAKAVTVGTPSVSTDGTSVTYPLSFADPAGVTMNAKLSVKDQTLTWTLTDITDPNKAVNTIELPDMSLVSVNGADENASIYAAKVSTNREATGDTVVDVPNSAAIASTSAWMITANDSNLAAGFETNAIPNASSGEDVRYKYQVAKIEGKNVGTVHAASWTYRSSFVAQYDDGTGIGVDEDPFIKVKITEDANGDDVVDWQDGAIAIRDIMTPINGAEDVKNYVVMRIPFNIVSQATHPFLRTLDDTKRISLATDNLGQEVLLKGYQAEGHDSAQGDYGNNYNERAGGLEDLKTLVEEGEDWNATFGIHVNATESYSEANCFSDGTNGYNEDEVAAPCELGMPPSAAWGWMNQAYYMNPEKDLSTGNVLDRLEQLRADFPEGSNLNWLYWDVYYKGAWQAQRFAEEMQDQGWRLSSEWSYALTQYSTWAHWATDENYGGSTNKGINSQLIRFVENSYRDTFNPDPLLGNANVVEFEGWTGQTDYNAFIENVWERNLPTKFLQQSDIMTWGDHQITFKNGTVVTSDLDSIAGNVVPTDRTITYDGATVFEQGDYLLPWTDGGESRLYYWNPGNEAKTWQLTDTWATQSSLKLYQLTDTGKVEVGDVAVSNGSVSLPATEANTAYVLYASSNLPETVEPNWGEGSNIDDPGFFSGTTDAYTTTGNVSVVQTDRGNFQAQLGEGESSLSQEISLPAGTYSAWAWVEIQPGQTREVTVGVSGDGITLPPAQTGESGKASVTIHSSSELNATASDEKFKTYFQRVPVHFTTDGESFTFFVQAGDDSAATVAVDDLRVVERATPEAEGDVEGTIVFEDFEDVDTGYYPFVTGSTQTGDARTQLAERHEPYSQAGWWALVDGTVTEGQKYTDNVLDGQWSLLAHQENGGMILRTTQGTVPLEQGHTYTVTFDYQAAFDGGYEMVLGHDEAGDNTWTEVVDQNWPIAQARGTGWSLDGVTGEGTQVFDRTFTVTSSDPTFLGVKNILGGTDQNDLIIDNFRVVDHGVIPYVTLSGEKVASDDVATMQMTLTSTVTVPEGTATQIEHAVAAPEGWTLTRVNQGSSTATAEKPSVAVWSLSAPKDAEPADVVLTATWLLDTVEGSATDTLSVDPGAVSLLNPIGGADLSLVSVSSEQTSGEPEGSGVATAAIDGNTSTYWHTKWTGSTYPHEIVVQPTVAHDAEEGDNVTCTLTGFEYTARQSAANGRAKGYEIYVSADGENWGEAVATGEFADVLTPQVIEFPQAVEGSYVKLVETSSHNGADFGGAAELRLGGVCSGGNITPSEPVVPADVTFVDEEDGDQSFTVPAVDGVEYVKDGEVIEADTYPAEDGQKVTVTARAKEGFTLLDGVATEWSHTFGAEEPEQPTEPSEEPSGEPSGEPGGEPTDEPSGEPGEQPTGGSTVVAPEDVTFVDQGDTRTFTIPTTAGVEYLVNGQVADAGTYEVEPGATVTVTARPLSGYTIAEDQTTEWSNTFSGDADGGKDDSRQPQSGLVKTGATVGGIGAMAMVLMVLGAAAVTRRKK